MENSHVSIREKIEDILDQVGNAEESLVDLSLKMAYLAGFKPDEYKVAIAKDGKQARCKKLTKNDKQKRFHRSPRNLPLDITLGQSPFEQNQSLEKDLGDESEDYV